MKTYLSLLAIIFPLSIALSILPFQAGFCEECGDLGKPCSVDGVLGKCCTGEQSNPDDSNDKYYLECKEDSTTHIGSCEKKEAKK